MNWHVVSVTSGCEMELAAKINSQGFIAHCPTWVRKFRTMRRNGHFYLTRTVPLFPTYFFIAEDAAFRKDAFESSKTRLTIFRKRLLTDDAMSMINSTALELTMAQTKMTTSLVIKRDDVMQLLHHALQGEPVDILEVRKNRVLVKIKVRPDWKEFWVDRTSLGKAM